MQKLQFESAWDKAISQQDRKLIEEIFRQADVQNNGGIVCSLIRTAINHKQQMLIMVLIHNFSDQQLAFDHRNVHCLLDEGTVTQNFTIKALQIPQKTSMPWTFIFEDSLDFLFSELLEVKIEE